MPSPIRRRPLVALAVFAILVGCAADRQGTDDANLVKPDTGGGDGTSSGAPPTDAAYIATRFSLFGQGGGGPAALHTASFSAGQTQTATLESLKYFIRSIQICEDVETQGTGTGKATGTQTVFRAISR